MKKIERFRKKLNNFMYDHFRLKQTLHELGGGTIGLISAFIFAFGFCCFTTPIETTDPALRIVTGGVSGLSQNIALIVKINGIEMSETTVQAIGYTCFNIPLVIFAFFKVGKRFAIQTSINVIASSLFINFLPIWGLSNAIAGNEIIAEHGLVFRILFAGVCTGVASALAFKGEFSCGGIDIVTYYLSLRKSTFVGKYSIAINSAIITLYSCLMVIDAPSIWSTAILSLFISVVYQFIVSFVIDMINLRNKKLQIEIITDNEIMTSILMANFPHGATIMKAKGAYSHNDRMIIYMVVSSFEVKKVVSMAKKVDEHAFISIVPLVQVYGNFFIRPIE